MDRLYKQMLKLVSSGLTGEAADIKEVIDFENIIKISKKHSIMTMLYYALYNSGIKLKDGVSNYLRSIVFGEIAANEEQLYYINELSERFIERDIKFVLLKGSVLKSIYPKTEIRRMGDIDILIKTEQYQEVSVVMEELGFSFVTESDHELVWKKGAVLVELHKILISTYNFDLYDYYGDGWKRAIPYKGSQYVFSENDMFIYVFSHFARHYRDAGIGIIHMCDLYMMLKSYNLDFEYISSELKKMKLYDFWCNIKATIDVWFNGCEGNDITDYITEVVFNSGVYGLEKNIRFSYAIKGKKAHKAYNNLFIGKLCRVFELVLPSYSYMKKKYNILLKLPFLLPVFWIVRAFTIVTKRGEGAKHELTNIFSVNEKEVSDYHKALQYVGLDFDFENRKRKIN